MEEKYMQEAMKEAQKAYKIKEIPVGSVIVYNNKVIARTHNIIEKKQCALKHAELLAISKASKKLNNWRLNDCILYTTLEPCTMCAGAIENSRIKEVYYLLPKKDSIKNTKYIRYNNKSLEDKYHKLLQNIFERNNK